MSDREGFERPQPYCRNCGARARQGNAFCVSCGERLDIEGDTQPVVHGSGSRNRSLLYQGNTKVALYGAGVLLLLVVAYLLLSYSVPLGFLLIGLSVFVVLVVRKTRGTQTRLEQRVFDRAGRYGGSARKAYEEGKHREFTQKAYRQSKEAYGGATARYRDWSESRGVGHERSSAPNTGIPFQGVLQSALQNFLRWFKGLPLALKAVMVVLGALLLLTVLSPLGLVVALLLFGASIIALIIRAAQRRSVKGWGAVAVTSLVLALAFGSLTNALYDREFLKSTGSSTDKATKNRPSRAASTPNYFVAESISGQAEGNRMVGLNVLSDSLHRENLRAIAEDIIEAEENNDWVAAAVYDSDSAVYDPGVRGGVKLRNPRGRRETGGIYINFSMENWEPKKGYYKVVEYCVSPQDCEYTYPIE